MLINEIPFQKVREAAQKLQFSGGQSKDFDENKLSHRVWFPHYQFWHAIYYGNETLARRIDKEYSLGLFEETNWNAAISENFKPCSEEAHAKKIREVEDRMTDAVKSIRGRKKKKSHWGDVGGLSKTAIESQREDIHRNDDLIGPTEKAEQEIQKWRDKPLQVHGDALKSDWKGKTMLVLTRRRGEQFFLGKNITVTVLGLNGNQVLLGIDAPKDIPVHRDDMKKGGARYVPWQTFKALYKTT